jgi:hypothetical protein
MSPGKNGSRTRPAVRERAAGRVGGYGLIGDDGDGVGRANRKRERLWLSPHCVRKADNPDLFSAVEDTALARLRACHGVGSLFDPGRTGASDGGSPGPDL